MHAARLDVLSAATFLQPCLHVSYAACWPFFLHSLDNVTTIRRLVTFYVTNTTARFRIRGFADNVSGASLKSLVMRSNRLGRGRTVVIVLI